MNLLVLLALFAAPQEPDVDALLKQLENESIEVREKAAAALVELGDPAEEKVKRRLASAEGAFKSQLESVLQAVRKERRLRAVFPRSRRISIDVKEAPLREVLDRLKKETGLPIDARFVGDPKVTVTVADVMPLQALDAVCRSADLEYLPGPSRIGDATVAIVLKRGYEKTPRVFSGPFVVSVPSIELIRTEGPNGDEPRYAEARLGLAVYWSPGFRPSKLVDLELEHAKDDKGIDLRRNHCFLDGRWESLAGVLPRPLEAFLSGPALASKSFSLKGRGALLFSLDQVILAFKSPGDSLGQVRDTDVLSIRLDKCSLESGSARFEVSVTQKKGAGPARGIWASEFSPANVRLATTDGRTSTNSSWTALKTDKGAMTVELVYSHLTSAVTALEFVFDSEIHRADFEFELKDIPLPR